MVAAEVLNFIRSMVKAGCRTTKVDGWSDRVRGKVDRKRSFGVEVGRLRNMVRMGWRQIVITYTIDHCGSM